MLESFKHEANSFITLTYDDENLPKGGTLVRSHYQNFLKKLRKRLQGAAIRYYFCGEYGEESSRPHYHAALFGIGPEDAEQIDKAWGKGFTYTGDLTHDSAQYIAGYVTKKMNHPESKCTDKCTHPPLNGRLPEFSQPSLKPGLGASAVNDIADILSHPSACDTLAAVGDVPHALTLERKQLPLGKYIRGKLREKMGFPDKKTPPESLDRWKADLYELYKEHSAASAETPLSKYIDNSQHFAQFLIDKNAQKVLQLETKNKIFTTRKLKI